MSCLRSLLDASTWGSMEQTQTKATTWTASPSAFSTREAPLADNHQGVEEHNHYPHPIASYAILSKKSKQNRSSFNYHQFIMNITERSSKSEIIDAATELVDTQQEQIQQLKQRQVILFSIIGLMIVISSF